MPVVKPQASGALIKYRVPDEIAGPTGPVGPAGAVGPAGVTGQQGSTGAVGPIGATGSQGITGQQGVQGAIGTTGAAGATGLQGTTGVQGTQGPAGTTGVQGSTGITGPQGAQGTAGVTGVQGSTGITGPQGAQGPAGITGAAGAQGITGQQGAQGPVGTTGAIGTTGAQGIVGPAGVTGPQGAAGPAGVTGVQGAAGVTGVQGASGVAGVTGAQGPAGVTGVQGRTGVQGSTGAQGVQGNTGVQGASGVQGITGAQGVQGPAGVTGSQGATGLQGNTGVQGAQGITGAIGATGSKGTTGSQGVTGVLGATGNPGVTGVQGPTGLIGDSLAHIVTFVTGGYLCQGKTGPASPAEGFFLGAFTGDAWKTYFSIGNTGSYFKFTPGSAGVEFAGTFRTGLTGQRVEMTSSDKEIRWYDQYNQNVAKIGPSLYGDLPGIILASTGYGGGLFFAYQSISNFQFFHAQQRTFLSSQTGAAIDQIERYNLSAEPIALVSEYSNPTGNSLLWKGQVGDPVSGYRDSVTLWGDGQMQGIPTARYIGTLPAAATGMIKLYHLSESPKDAYSVLCIRGYGVDGNNSIVDECGKSITVGGDAQFDTAKFRSGISSILFDGTGDYLTAADSADWNFGSGAFTIEFDFIFNALPSATSMALMSQYADGTHYWWLYFENTGGNNYFKFYATDAGALVGLTSDIVSISTGTPYHFALVRQGSDWWMFLNGIKICVGSDADSMPDIGGTLRIGMLNSNYYFNGWLGNIHIAKGVARWINQFTPPMSAVWQMPPDGTNRLLPNVGIMYRPDILHLRNRTLRLGPTNYVGYAGATGHGLEAARTEILFSGYRDTMTDTVAAKIVGLSLATSYGTAAQYGALAFYTLDSLPSVFDATTEKMRLTSSGQLCVGVTGSNERGEFNGNVKMAQLIMSNYTPGSTGATGVAGCFAADDSYVYYRTTAGWKRAAIAGW